MANEIKLRTHNTQDVETLSAHSLLRMDRERNTLFDELGIDFGTGKEWDTLPFVGDPEKGIKPRFFMMQKGDDGFDRPVNIDPAQLKPGSPEFWQEIQRGNIFAYPAGKNDPVQLQIKAPYGKSSPTRTIELSEPVTSQNMPGLVGEREPEPLSALAKIVNFITFGRYKREQKRAYDNYQAGLRPTKEFLRNNANERKKLNVKDKTGKTQEEKDFESIRENRANAKDQAARDEEFRKAKGNAEYYETKNKAISSIFHPQPKDLDLPGLHKKFDPETKKVTQDGLYTDEQFNDLKVYGKDEIDLDKIKIGESGEAVSAEEFAALAYFGMWDDDLGYKGKGFDPQNAQDLTIEETMKYYGYSEEETRHMVATTSRSMYTADLYMSTLRANEGNYFKEYTNAGREIAVNALKAYQGGDKEKLAQLIASSVNNVAEELTALEDGMTEQARGNIDMSVKLLNLMEKDPQLAEIAFTKGMKQDKLEVVKGMKVLNQLDKDAREAELEIATARKNHDVLSEEKKQELSKKIIKAKYAEMRLSVENRENKKEFSPLLDTLEKNKVNGKMDVVKVWHFNPEKRPKLPEGKIYEDSISDIRYGITAVRGKLPSCVAELTTAKGQDHLDRIAEQICKDQNFRNMSENDLSKKLVRVNGATNINIINATEKAYQNLNIKKPGKEENLEINKEININTQKNNQVINNPTA